MTRTLMLCACLLTPFLATGCDGTDDVDTEYREQLEGADVSLADAMAPVTDETEGVIVDAVFELGVDDGFYLVEVVIDDELVVFEVDARTGERVEAERRRARADRADLARRHRPNRRRLAQLVREIRAERGRDGERAVRARLVGDEAEIELMDRRGRRHDVRRRLASR